MNKHLNETIKLWDKLLEGTASAREQARFHALLEDPSVVEAFASWQISHASLPLAAASQAASSKALAPKILKIFAKHSIFKAIAPWVVGAAVAGGASAAYMALKGPETAALEPAMAPEMLRTPRPAQARRQSVPGAGPALPGAPQPQIKPKKPSLGVVVSQAAPGKVSILIYDRDGRPVRKLYEGELQGGIWEFDWDGKDSLDAYVQDGTYKVVVISGAQRRESLLELSRKPGP